MKFVSKLQLRDLSDCIKISFSLLLLAVSSGIVAQVEQNNLVSDYFPKPFKVALKSNLVYDATATLNLGVEFKLSNRYTWELSGNYNPWTFSDNKKWRHWLVHTELRYWFCHDWNGHFVGLHAQGGEFNMGNISNNLRFLGTDFTVLNEHRMEGWTVGGGVSYGYSWILSKHWNVEAQWGVGYMYSLSDVYECVKCGDQLETDKPHHYLGPTKAAVNLIYVF